jgi:hypothetical protein
MNEPLADIIPFMQVTTDFSRYGFSDNASNFRATRVVDSVRWKEMERWQRYFECKQHDAKRYDFDGRLMAPRAVGSGYSQPLISAERATWYVPLRARKPSTPYRIGRRIVLSFTSMVFGESRWPDVLVNGDTDAQEFLNALVEETGLPTKMIQLRNIGGSVGTAGLSWCYHNGVPNVEVHNGKGIIVHEWANKAKLRPKHVTEVYRYERDHWDARKRSYVRELWWHRQDWTETADVVFKECKVEENNEPRWEVDEELTTIHNDGFCHFVYVQNIPPIDGVDGLPDCDGVWDQMDTLDILVSILARGGVLNLDPTLKLKMDPELVEMAFVRKGSDNALVTGETGDASYMELAGSSITAGISLMQMLRVQTLESTECVIPDPDKVAAAGTSSVALKMVYAPMLSKCDLLRDQYGKALRELLRQMLVVAQRIYKPRLETRNGEDGTDEEVEVTGFIHLQPKVIVEPVFDEDGEETDEESVTMEPHTPGTSSYIELSWGPYFRPTADDQQKTVSTLTQGTGGKAVLSQKTAVELLAGLISRDPSKMLDELYKEQDAEAEKRKALMDSMGGQPGQPVEPMEHEDETEEQETETEQPPVQASEAKVEVTGEEPVVIDEAGQAPPPPAKEVSVTLTAADVANIVTVNEARASQGLGPLRSANGEPDPDGNLMVSEFKAKRAAMIAMVAGAEQGQAPGEEPPPDQGGFGGGFGG